MTRTSLEGGDLQYHIECRPGDVGRYVLLPGDPGRVPLLASLLDDAREVACNREYLTYTGTLDGVPVSVTSTGIGCPSTAIAIEELAKLGADTFIRVGTSGKVQPSLATGDLIVVTGAVRDEGTSQQYMPLAFPAIADIDVVNALREACHSAGVPFHTGITQSKDSFYGQHEPERMPVADQLQSRWQAWVRGGVLCSEMEASTLFVLSSVLGLRAGAVMITADTGQSLDSLCAVAVDGMRRVIARDQTGG